MNNIYNLKVFETMIHRELDNSLDGVTIRRVPGGWTFTEWTTSTDVDAENNQTYISTTFVPYNEEFLKDPAKQKLF